MVSVCLYFQVHLANELSKYSVLDIGQGNNYFSTEKSMENTKKIAKEYMASNQKLLDTLKNNQNFKLSFSISGTALEQFGLYSPKIITSFKSLLDTGQVEFLSETYYHSLSSVFSKSEFIKQIKLHSNTMKTIFGVKPTVFRNTELIYNNELAKLVEGEGFIGILADGAPYADDSRSPNYIYTPQNCKTLKLFLKNYKLSDYITNKINDKSWSEYPMSAKKYAFCISRINGSGNIVNLFMDYNSINSSTLKIISTLPKEILFHKDNNFLTIGEACKRYDPIAELDAHNLTSWKAPHLGPWMSNSMQKSALSKLFDLENNVVNSGNQRLINDWRNLQVSDYFYNMSINNSNPYDTFISYMNIMNDLSQRINAKGAL